MRKTNTLKKIVYGTLVIILMTTSTMIVLAQSSLTESVTQAPYAQGYSPQLLPHKTHQYSSKETEIVRKQQYMTIDLAEATDPLGVVQCEATGINNNGEVVGYEVLNVSMYRSIYWARNGSATILENYQNDNSSLPYMIDDTGLILGWSALVTYEQHGGFIELHMNQTAVTWKDLVIANLNDQVTGGDSLDLYHARDINDAGVIVGSGAPFGHEPPPWWPNGFILNQGTVTDLGSNTYPEAINNQGHIVGSIEAAYVEAYEWKDGMLIDLNDPAYFHAGYSRAYDINDNEVIVGFAQWDQYHNEEPVAWINQVPIRLITSASNVQGYATAINSQNEIVGYFIDLDSPNPVWLAFLWKDNETVILNDFLPPEQGWEDIYPADINDHGQIVGLGYRTDIGWRAFLITPVTQPATPTLSGPSVGVTKYSYNYTVAATDPAQEELFYQIDWGDSTTSGWLGPYPSGQEVTVQHSWNESGSYQIKAKAKDMYGAESNWSDSILMMISTPVISMKLHGGIGVAATLKNTGGAPATDITWNITLVGGKIITGKHTTGSLVSLAVGESAQINTKSLFGFGKTAITIQAECRETNTVIASAKGFVLFFFAFGVK